MVDAPSRRGGADGDAKPPSGPRGPRILVDPALSSLAITIEADGEGLAPTFVGRVEQPELDPDVRRRIHHRLGTTFGAALREWVDEPHR